ncbi:amine acid ABC transporter, permease protein, 3-TM region, His/Glu/Gln/Arg/opine family [Paracoccus homiensis]|uniref:Amine acid ABC transporter, permease protein, 3-TM region, His/Glu/Gln/Arg/opine family n=2 Tax=Paracoccus homiensis TaxID=364199 RepID=A0A1I0JA46_9RHOB|nr:amine acid ABC transporter, permease protein, 3-TM region, His/Glu/Gln/Arg/opine family [Paracoccus homiensis]
MEPFEREGLADWIGPLLDGAFVTLQIALAAYALGLMLGLAGAAAKLGGSATLRGIAAAYTSLVRAIPELLLIILLYYAGTQGLNAALQAMRARRV